MSVYELLRSPYQQTIAGPVTFVGIGLHSGERAKMRLLPAAAGQGITLVRRDLPPHEQRFGVHWRAVRGSTLCTAIGNSYGHAVATIEHLLSALAALGIDNGVIELDGPEIPIMDGSALPFVEAIDSVGLRSLNVPRSVIVIRRPVRLQQGASWAELLPDTEQRISVSIDFDSEVIGTQSMSIDITSAVYRREIAPARTFGFADQLECLRRRRLALGGSIKNAILVRDGRVANPEGLRFRDEFVRHKVLDVIGDLSLAGAPILGHYRGNRPGHQLNTDLVTLLMEDADAWAEVPVEELVGLPDDPLDHAGHGTPERHGRADGTLETRDRRALRRPLAERLWGLFGDGSD